MAVRGVALQAVVTVDGAESSARLGQVTWPGVAMGGVKASSHRLGECGGPMLVSGTGSSSQPGEGCSGGGGRSVQPRWVEPGASQLTLEGRGDGGVN